MIRFIKYSFSIQQSPLPYPFQYTIYPNEFVYFDPRFTQYPAARLLHQKETQHIHQVLKTFANLYNQQKVEHPPFLKFIYPSLIQKLTNFQQFMKEEEIKSKMSINFQTVNKSNGFLEYYGALPALMLENQPIAFMHEFLLNKNHQKLEFKERQTKEQKEAKQKKIAKEINIQSEKEKKSKEMQKNLKALVAKGSFFKGLKQRFFGDRQKNIERLKSVHNFIDNIGKKEKVESFKEYILVDRVDGVFNLEFTQNSEVKVITNRNLVTKWLYHVDANQPEDIRRSRKRTLMDFQMWNRGTFVKVKDFNSQDD